MENSGNFGNHASSDGSSIDHIKSNLQEVGKQAGEIVKKAACDLKAMGEESFSACSSESKKQLNSVKSYVENNPMKSVAYGVALGFVFNKLFSK